jgi:hypothetical protein
MFVSHHWQVKQGWMCCLEDKMRMHSTGYVDHDRYVIALLTEGARDKYYEYGRRTLSLMPQACRPTSLGGRASATDLVGSTAGPTQPARWSNVDPPTLTSMTSGPALSGPIGSECATSVCPPGAYCRGVKRVFGPYRGVVVLPSRQFMPPGPCGQRPSSWGASAGALSLPAQPWRVPSAH